jgi:predicted acylesterase/phospholipase RssA
VKYQSPTSSTHQYLSDGGLVNPVPVTLCRALGADVVIAVNLHKNVIIKTVPENKAFENKVLSNLWPSVSVPLPKTIQDTASSVTEYVSLITIHIVYRSS